MHFHTTTTGIPILIRTHGPSEHKAVENQPKKTEYDLHCDSTLEARIDRNEVYKAAI